MSFSVNKEPLVWITVRDGIKLAAKLWLPDADKSEKFPAILGENYIDSKLISY